ncbi:MAG TPA: hypothetical protein PLT31_08685 [Fibrobacteraceae bacterium]|nr:hypothetical protein [Fibrobacteraceae bacterium]
MPSNESSVKLVTQIKEQVAEMETQLNGLQIPEAVLKHINAMLGDVLEHTEAAVALIKIGMHEAALIQLKGYVEPPSILPG